MKQPYYPTSGKRLLLERKIVSCLVSECQYNRVSFLQPNDFINEDCKKAFSIIRDSKGNHSESIRKDIFIIDMTSDYDINDFYHVKYLGLLLVECNISRAIHRELEQCSFSASDDLERQFLLKASQDALFIDALKLHESILSFIEPAASKGSKDKISKIVNRISKRIKTIKEWQDYKSL